MTTTAATATSIRSIGKCQTCKAAHLYIGSPRFRHGQVCLCGQAQLVHFTSIAPSTPRGMMTWRKVRVTVTSTPCDAACYNAKSDACACSCKGENHGEAHHAKG